MQMNTQGAAAALVQHVEITLRLRQLDRAEAELAIFERHVFGMVAGEREKDAAVRAALVRLAGRMQIARSETETGGHALPVADAQPQSFECCFVLAVSLHVSQKSEIVV